MILVDAYWMMHKYRNLLDYLTNSDGEPTGMEYGVLRTCEALDRDLKGDVVLCWESSSFRYDVFEGYKANRGLKTPLDSNRVKKFKAFCKQVYHNAEYQGLEADDVIACITAERSKAGKKTIIFSNDKDMLQLIDEHTVLLKAFREKKYPWNVETVEKQMNGLSPSDMVTFQGWVGDRVDNIPGSGLPQPKIASAILWQKETGRAFKQWPGWTTRELKKMMVFKPRFDLVTLVRDKHIEIQEPLWQKEQIEAWLVHMNICSLKICAKVGMFMDEEF